MSKGFALFLFSLVNVFGEVDVAPPQSNNKQEVIVPNESAQREDSKLSKPAQEVAQKDAPVHPENPQPFKLMPHKAIYEIKLHPHKKPADPTVLDVTGTGSIELVKTKEGWSYKQSLEVQIHYHDSTTTTIERNIASWESPSEVSFHIENFRDGASESILQGGAELGENSEWRVYFQKPEMDGFITNKNLVFPIGHLEKILSAIEKGQQVLSDQIVFDATYEMHEPVRINTVINPLKDKKLTLNDSSLLPSSKVWRIQEAFYDLESTNTIPDYEESSVDLFSTGVISTMEVSWGEGITVVLNLKELIVYQ